MILEIGKRYRFWNPETKKPGEVVGEYIGDKNGLKQFKRWKNYISNYAMTDEWFLEVKDV